MGGLAGAWLLGVAITAWRESRASGHMPVPAALLGVTGLFAGLALAADIWPATRALVTTVGYGLDVAGLFQILPAGLFQQISTAQTTEEQASAAPAAPVQAV